jgi:uncharacterized protein YmfQ (DUF2313 family)
MSKWHAIEGVTHNGETLAGIEVTRWPRVALSQDTVAISDALADPDGADLNRSHVTLLPQGAAWGTPDGAALPEETILWKFWRAITEPIVTTYRDLWSVAMSSTSVSLTLAAALEDWEIEYGLPDPCLGPDQSFAQRYKWLRFRVLSKGTITPGDFLNLAAEAGHDILIEEPEFFELGHSDLGGPDETGSPEMEHRVIVWPVLAGEYGFVFSEGMFGETPLYSFDGIDLLECLLPGLLSAGYVMQFNYTYNTSFPAS